MSAGGGRTCLSNASVFNLGSRISVVFLSHSDLRNKTIDDARPNQLNIGDSCTEGLAIIALSDKRESLKAFRSLHPKPSSPGGECLT